MWIWHCFVRSRLSAPEIRSESTWFHRQPTSDPPSFGFARDRGFGSVEVYRLWWSDTINTRRQTLHGFGSVVYKSKVRASQFPFRDFASTSDLILGNQPGSIDSRRQTLDPSASLRTGDSGLLKFQRAEARSWSDRAIVRQPFRSRSTPKCSFGAWMRSSGRP